MNKAPVHTPYDGSSQPFTIGLQQLDLKDWIEVDENLLAYLAERGASLICMLSGFSSRNRGRKQRKQKFLSCSLLI